MTISAVSERFQNGAAHPLSRVFQAVRSTAALLSFKDPLHVIGEDTCPSSVLGCPMAGIRESTLHGILDDFCDWDILDMPVE